MANGAVNGTDPILCHLHMGIHMFDDAESTIEITILACQSLVHGGGRGVGAHLLRPALEEVLFKRNMFHLICF